MRHSALVVFAVAAVSMMLAAGSADAAKTLTYTTTSSATLRTAIPTKLAAGTQGATALGVNQTTATTILNANNQQNDYATLLNVKSVSGAGEVVKLRYRSSTTLANVKSATIVLGGVSQIVVTNGVVTQSSGANVALGAGLTISSSGLSVQMTTNAATATIMIDVLASPSAATGQSVDESWTLSLT